MVVLTPRFVAAKASSLPLQTCHRCRLAPRQLFRPFSPSPAPISSSTSLSKVAAGRRLFSTQPVRGLRSAASDHMPLHRFTYHAASSFSGKNDRFDPATNLFHYNPYNHVQPTRKRPKSKRVASGQDAFFISRLGDPSSTLALGVADGVGGWEESGVDPSDFSHSFCDYMASAAYQHAEGQGRALTARSLMQRGYDDVVADRSIKAGGSTACVALADAQGCLDVANLGDSGFVQLRLNAVHAYSAPQTHGFNTPYQLSIVPASMLARAAAFGGAQLCDYPKDADVSSHSVAHGDILIFATDGVWDNLFNQDILRIASRLMKGTGAWAPSEAGSDGGIHCVDDLGPLVRNAESQDDNKRALTLQGALALEIAGAAKVASLNRRVDGPFAKEVQKYYPGEAWRGGKIDDICVIVAIVADETRSVRSKL